MMKNIKSVDTSYIDYLLHSKNKKEECTYNPSKHEIAVCPVHGAGNPNVNYTYEQKGSPNQTSDDKLAKVRKKTEKYKAVNAYLEAKKRNAELTTPKNVDVGGNISKAGKNIKTMGDEIQNIPVGKSGKTIYGKYDELNDQELREKINRIKNEREYSNLKGDTVYVKSGKDKVREVLQTLGSIIGIAGTVVTIVSVVKGWKKPSANHSDFSELEHHGVKGMKWGIVNTVETSGNKKNEYNEKESRDRTVAEGRVMTKKALGVIGTIALGPLSRVILGDLAWKPEKNIKELIDTYKIRHFFPISRMLAKRAMYKKQHEKQHEQEILKEMGYTKK